MAFCHGNASACNTGTGGSVLKKKKKTDNQDWSCCGMEAEIKGNTEIVEQSHRNLCLQNTASVNTALVLY